MIAGATKGSASSNHGLERGAGGSSSRVSPRSDALASDSLEGRPPDDGLHVLQLGPDPQGGGGMATVIRGLLESPLAERHRLEMVTSYRSSHGLRRLLVFSGALAALVRWCLGPGPRIVHIHTTVRGSMYRKAIFVAVAKALRRPVVLHVHAGAAEIEVFHARLGRVRRGLLRRGIAMADRVLSVSSAGARALGERFARRDVAVVPNAAPPVKEERSRPPAEGGDAVTVLYLGGFANPVKGGEVLLEALGSFAPAAPSLRVLLAGPGDPPAAAVPLLEQSSSLRWLGWLDEEAKAQALAASDVFVLPSISEGLPMALLEGMAEGLAVVATDMGGVPDVVTHGVDGLLVPPGDAAALGAAIRTLVEQPARRAELARAARARAERLGETEVCGRLDAIYGELAGA